MSRLSVWLLVLAACGDKDADSGTADGGAADGGADGGMDGGAADGGAADGGVDGGAADGGVDGGAADGGVDGGAADGGVDGGSADGGAADGGAADGGAADGGAADGGAADGGEVSDSEVAHVVGGHWAHVGGSFYNAPIGDVDGDGQEDLFVSYVSYGHEFGWTTTANGAVVPGPFTGVTVLSLGDDLWGARMGHAHGGGDADGDGYDDFVYGNAARITYDSDALIPPISLVHGPIDLDSGDGGDLRGVGWSCAECEGGLGWAEMWEGWGRFAWLADQDGDGVADLLWGHYQTLSLTLGPLVTGEEEAAGAVTIDSRSGLSEAGIMDAGFLDDLDGDGLPEIALTWSDFGASHVFESTETLPADLDGFGWSLRVVAEDAMLRSAGDVDGDGDGDLAVAMPWSDTVAPLAGEVWIVTDTSSTPIEAHDAACRIEGPGEDAHLGADAQGVGDWTGDGADEVAVGAPYEDRAPTEAGLVALFSCREGGTLELDDARAILQISEEELDLDSRCRFGTAISTLADLDGDGLRDEFAVTAGDWAVCGVVESPADNYVYGTIFSPEG